MVDHDDGLVDLMWYPTTGHWPLWLLTAGGRPTHTAWKCGCGAQGESNDPVAQNGWAAHAREASTT